jgi:hypothetical protein
VPGQLVPQRQGRGGGQALLGVVYQPGRAGTPVGQVEDGAYARLGQQRGHQAHPLAEIRGGEDLCVPRISSTALTSRVALPACGVPQLVQSI